MSTERIGPDRFWVKINEADMGYDSECWLWTAATNDDGYGLFGLNGGGCVLAHRFAYELLIGPIPVGLELDHLCRIRACVNPPHLDPVTHLINVRRGESIAVLNAAKTHCPQGHPLEGENLRLDYKNRRRCYTCRNQQAQQSRARQRARLVEA